MTASVSYFSTQSRPTGSATGKCLPSLGGRDRGRGTGALASGYRFEYDGLNLLRMDQLYDSNSNGLTEADAWRKLWVNTYCPRSIGGLVGKRVYTYDDNKYLVEKKKETKSGSWSQAEKWTYEWNPRDELRQALKYTTGTRRGGRVI